MKKILSGKSPIYEGKIRTEYYLSKYTCYHDIIYEAESLDDAKERAWILAESKRCLKQELGQPKTWPWLQTPPIPPPAIPPRIEQADKTTKDKLTEILDGRDIPYSDDDDNFKWNGDSPGSDDGW
eukprot:Lithocolla_globosa_v1_NODE_270_length_4733_cov_5.457265.p4 type:complete len:125 gc:universal NODE_270_length_4733_cov_5.457265:638-1012(+)